MTGEFFIFSLVMKISLATLFLLFFPAAVFAQQLGQVTFSRSSSALSYFSFVTDQGVLIRVSPEGKILEWGTEVLSDRGNYFAPKLQPFMGKVDYYGAADDSVFQGKVKSIGTCFITYYDSFQVKTKAGKVKMLGNQMLDYFEPYEDKLLAGRMKQAGALTIDYYRSWEDESVRGKLKLVGSVPISYYTVFDDRVNAGKLKSVGSANYTWYSLSDRADLRGALKSNNYRQIVSGVTYILR